jgi:hypothetical protein
MADSVSLAGVEQAAAEGRLATVMIPLERLLPGTPAVVLSSEGAARVLNGSPLSPGHLAPPSAEAFSKSAAVMFRLFDSSGSLLALARPSAGRDRLLPFLVIR